MMKFKSIASVILVVIWIGITKPNSTVIVTSSETDVMTFYQADMSGLLMIDWNGDEMIDVMSESGNGIEVIRIPANQYLRMALTFLRKATGGN